MPARWRHPARTEPGRRRRTHLGAAGPGAYRRRLAGIAIASGLVMAGTVGLLRPTAAWACGCVGGGPDPEVVFTGVAIDAVEVDRGSHWRFTVVDVDRGDPGDQVLVGGFVAASGVTNTCDRSRPEVGAVYDLHARRIDSEPGLTVELCGGWIKRLGSVPNRGPSDGFVAAASAAGFLLGGSIATVGRSVGPRSRRPPAGARSAR